MAYCILIIYTVRNGEMFVIYTVRNGEMLVYAFLYLFGILTRPHFVEHRHGVNISTYLRNSMLSFVYYMSLNVFLFCFTPLFKIISPI